MDNNSEVVYLHLDDIIPNRFQPREVFDEQALKELAVSIKEHGVIQPIIVRKVDNKYEIIAGERRYKASTMAGLNKIPAIIKNLDDKESSKVALIENLQRRDLTPIEEARTYQKILELEDSMTQEELAATMGKTQSSVSNKLRLLALPDEIQDALLNEKISERHARCLLNIEDANEQVKMLGRIIEEKLTVRELDKIIKESKQGPSDGSSGVEQEGATETAQPEEAPAVPTGPIIKGFPVINNNPKNAEETLIPGVENIPAVEVAQEEGQVIEEQPVEGEQVQEYYPEEGQPQEEQPQEEYVENGEYEQPVEGQYQEGEGEYTEQEYQEEGQEENYDFDAISNPFEKHSDNPEEYYEEPQGEYQEENIASVVENGEVVSEPIVDYDELSESVDALIVGLADKGFNAYYDRNEFDDKTEFIITVEK